MTAFLCYIETNAAGVLSQNHFNCLYTEYYKLQCSCDRIRSLQPLSKARMGHISSIGLLDYVQVDWACETEKGFSLHFQNMLYVWGLLI